MKSKAFLVVIITCWILLVLALICKLFGANWFTPAIDSERFINFCTWLDNHKVVYIIVATIFYVPSTYLYYLAVTNQKFGKDLWIILLFIPCAYLKSNSANKILLIIGFILEVIFLIVIPLLKLKGKQKFRVLIGLGLATVFQLISILTRLYTWNLANKGALVGIIFNIDYYIMLILCYLHIRYAEKNKEKECEA